jgi:hypothetical protein
MGEMRNVILIGKPGEERPLGEPRRRGEGNITVNKENERWEGVD